MAAAKPVDLRPLKAWARRRLPPDDAVRKAILAQPDELPSDAFAGLAAMLVRMMAL